MKIIYYLLLLLCTFQLKAQEIIEEQAFYFEKLPIKYKFFFNTDSYENQKLASFINEMSGLPKVNSVNSKYFKENDYSVFEIYNEDVVFYNKSQLVKVDEQSYDVNKFALRIKKYINLSFFLNKGHETYRFSNFLFK